MKIKSILLGIFLIIPFGFTLAYATSMATLHLDTSTVLREGKYVDFSGQLVSPDGSPISNRTIFIEDDTVYTRPDIILAVAITDAEGKFSTSWKAVQKDNGSPYHFYAKFIGGKTFGYTRSETYESVFVSLDDNPNHETIPSKTMPNWFKDTSKLWHDGKIRETDYDYAIQNLIDYGIIPLQHLPSSEMNIPSWIKNDANWWAEGQIQDNEFTAALEYVIDNNSKV
ncbi:MAG TPA: hypothetical protein VK431_01560 [Nitrosopumilaceae archaeon]|nr:hypothetical protein [Nitrosopumilaceae archaeon]